MRLDPNTMGGITKNGAFVHEQCKSPHYTNLFSLVHSQDTISGLQSFSSLVGHKSLGAKDHSFFCLILFLNNPSILQQGHLSVHTYMHT